MRRAMEGFGLFLLRVSTGWLLVLWGLDKFFATDHAVRVAENFYLGIGSQKVVLWALGGLEILLGLAVVLGFFRKWAYPATAVVLGITMLSVWNSIIDPWGWVFQGNNALFYPSLPMFAGALVLWGAMDRDHRTLDALR